MARAAAPVTGLIDRRAAVPVPPEPPEALAGPPAPVRRLRVAVAVVALTALAFTQQPGLVVGDTKADLVLDPGGLLRRALSAWDPQQAFGQLPNQSYGYLWPMGPFFWLGHAAGLPPWVVQRAWWSLLLVVGFAGALRLAGVLGIGTPATRLVAAVGYAASPRVLSVLGSISVEAWPAAVLPWVLVPLVLGARGRLPPRRAAALSGVGVLCLGGVNAAATLAVLPLPLLYLVTRPRGVRGRLLAWWGPVVLLATAWWVLPLLVLGRYAYPFLGLIEDARVTTGVTTLTNTLRGTSHWLGFLAVHGAARWPAGFELAVSPLPVVATAGVAAAGLAGLLLLPGLDPGPRADRRWLLGAVLLGAVLVAVGHVGTLTSPLAPAVRDLLDGPLAPLRNVHKADPVLRLPLALGVAHLLAVAARARWRRLPGLAVAVVAALLAGTATPAWSGRLAPDGGFARTPTYWREVAGWLAARSVPGQPGGGGRALLVPSANFAVYAWGSPQDEPLQALARSPWAVRDAVPLGAPGATRLLDALDARLATGQPSAAYAAVLARAGVRYVVLRNDVDVPRSGAERPGVLRAALDGSPGIRRVAGFGPPVRTAYSPGDRVVGPAGRRPAVEVFEVGPAPQRVAAYPRAGALALSGGPEGVLPLADAGLLDGRAVIAAADLPGTGAVDAVVGTDTLRRRSLNAGADPGRRYSPTLPAGQQRERDDVLPYAGPTRETVAVLEGGAGVAASSSAADPFAVGYRGPQRRPEAAFDGDPGTAWVSDLGGAGEWVELRLLAPASPRSVLVTPLDDPSVGPQVTRLEVRTDAGTAVAEVPAGERPVRVELPPRPTSRVRVTVARVAGGTGGSAGPAGSVGLREVAVDGVRVTEAVALPPDAEALAAAGLPWTVLAQHPDGARGDCVREPAAWVCVGGLAAPGEEAGPLERRFGTPAGARVTLRGTVRPRPGAELDALLDRSGGYRATGSSVLTPHPAARAGAAYDGDPATAWFPAGSDPAPQLRLDLGGTAELRGLRLSGARADYAGVARVVLRAADGELRMLPARPGRLLPFRPVRTREVVLTFERKAGGGDEPVPVAVRDVELAGAPHRTARPVEIGCGRGPGVGLDGAGRRLAVRAAAADLLTLAPVAATACGGPVGLGAGGHRLTTGRTAAFEVASVELTGGAPPAGPPPARAVDVQRWEPESRRLQVAPGGEAYLTLAEGFNAGWRATAGGRELAAVRLDGWRQGWVLPAGGVTTVEVRYAPGARHRAGLLVGLAAALLVLALALVPARRSARPAPPPGLPRSRRRWWVAVAAAGGLAVLLAGPAGLLAAAAPLLPARHRPAAAGGALVLAGLVLGLAPTAGWQPALSQLLSLTALALVTAALVGEPEDRPLEQHP